VSSRAVRSAITGFFNSQISEETVFDLTGNFEVLEDALAEAGIGREDTWVGLEFIPGDEQPITVGAGNTKGKYRETGAVYINVVDIAKLGVSGSILTRAEAVRDKLRGQVISGVVVKSITPPNFGAGAAFNFEDGYMSCSFILEYYFDIDL
jgi:hypothetical protein